MLKKKIKIVNKLGLHARAAMKLVNTASRYISATHINYNNRVIDAKDIMEIMVLAASEGSEIELQINGDDETEALNAIEKLINDRFGEPE